MAPEPDPSSEPGPTAIIRVFGTVELLEKILHYVDHQTFSNSCNLVSKFWHEVISGSLPLKQFFYLTPSPTSEVLLWRYKNNTPVRTPIRPFDLHPKIRISRDVSELDKEPRTWDRTVCYLYPALQVQPSISPRTISDIKFSADSILQVAIPGPWLNAYITQPPCTMSQIYIQKFVDIRRSAHRMKRYLDPEDTSFATLGKLRIALMTREEILDRGGNLGEALRKFDGDKSLFIDGFVHTDAVLVGLARGKYPDAMDPADATG